MSRSLSGTRTLASARSASSNRIGDLGITKALMLDSFVPQYISFGNQTCLNGTPFTMCIRVWCTASNTGHDGTLWSYGWQNTASPNTGYMLRASGNTDATGRRIQFWWGNSNTTAINLALVGQKYIFAEFDGSTTLRLYDGITLKDTLTIGAKTSAALPTYMGTRDTVGRNLFGVVGDGALYNRVLTSDEKRQISKLANYPTSGLQIMVKNNEGTGTTITDYSGNGRNGTLITGAPGAHWRNSPFNA